MNAPVLDTLRCAQTLRTAGFPDNQAEAMAQVLGDALTDVATKTDLDNAIGGLKTELKADIAQLDGKIDTLEAKVDSSVAGLEAKIDSSFGTLDAKIDSSVAGLEAKIDTLEAKVDSSVASLEAKIDNSAAQLDTKVEAVNQRLDSFETSVQRQLGAFADQLKHQARVTYALGGILITLITLVLGSVVAPHISWDAPATTPPVPTESPAAEAHTTPAQTSTEAQPPTPPPNT